MSQPDIEFHDPISGCEPQFRSQSLDQYKFTFLTVLGGGADLASHSRYGSFPSGSETPEDSGSSSLAVD